MDAPFSHIHAAIDAERLPPVCFVVCADRGLARDAALSFARRYCAREDLEHDPDFFDLACPLPVERLRALLRELAHRSFSEGKRCVRISEAELLSEQEQNLLLKTLEEPPPRTLFLLCGNHAAMLPTVRSRCAALRLGTLSGAQLVPLLEARGAGRQDAQLYAQAAESYAEALALCTDAEARAFREEALQSYMALLHGTPPYARIRERKGDRAAAERLALYWLSFTRDMLASRFSLPLRNADFAKSLGDCAALFTSERINAMIDMLTNALARLKSNASPGASLDWLTTQMLEDRCDKAK